MKRWSIGLGLVALVGCAADAGPVSGTSQALEAGDKLVIRSVYGGGGNGGSALKSDYVELFNAGTTTVSLAGLSLQYASAAGSVEFGSQDDRLTVLPSEVSLAPGQSYLVRGASQGGGNVDLVTPNFLESGRPLAMSGSAGRIALVNGTDPVTCKAVTACSPAGCVPCNQDPSVIDLVGYGTGNAVSFGSPAGGTMNTQAITRKANGCQDTKDNSADFEVVSTIVLPATDPLQAVQPRTSESTLQPCTTAEDAGAADAGSEADAAVDAGPAPIDAGSDAGPAPVDAGADTDAGPAPVDAGGETDAGPAPVDAGSESDAGVVLPELPEGLLIRQVFGGGGNNGATLKNDFIELFNAGTVDVSLAQLSLQYAAATGNSGFGGRDGDFVHALPAVTLVPGQSFLVAAAAQGGGTVDLPTPDTSTTALSLGATSGRVALVLGTSPLTCSVVACSAVNCVACPDDARVIDIFGYGSGNALTFGSPTGNLSVTTSASRLQGGCQDTGDNSVDFAIGEPTPRNTASPVAVCGTVVDPVDAGTDPVDAGSEPTPDAGSNEDAGITPVDAGSEQDAAVRVDAGSEPGDGSDQDGSEDGSDEDGSDADGASGDGTNGDGWFEDGFDDGIKESKDSSCSVTSYGNAGSAAPLAFAGLALVLARRRRRMV